MKTKTKKMKMINKMNKKIKIPRLKRIKEKDKDSLRILWKI